MVNKSQNQDFLDTINQSLKDLGALDISAEKFKMVIKSMNQSYRFYHNDYHLKEMTLIPDNHIEELEKLGVKNFNKFLAYIRIAGFFHDIIYIQVDGSVDIKFKEILEKNFSHKGNEWCVTSVEDDEILKLCIDIFDIPIGEVIPMQKINEFLSAAVGGRILKESGLDTNTIAKIVFCIEATVPFRSQEDFSEREKRLQNILPADEIDETMYASVYLSNKDCYNFSGYETHSVNERLLRFLQNTWRLALENIPDVKDKPIYADYFLQMAKNNLNFFNFMTECDKYKSVFHFHKDYPTKFRMTYFEERTKELLSYASISHRIKMISASIFCAFDSFENEGEYQLSLLNELASIHIRKHEEEFFVFNQENSRTTVKDAAILESLTCGKSFPSAIFDGGKTPIGRFLYKALSEEKIMELSSALIENDFFAEENKTVRKSKAMDFMYKFAYSIDVEVFDVLLNTVLGIFTQLNSLERINYLNKFKTIY